LVLKNDKNVEDILLAKKFIKKPYQKILSLLKNLQLIFLDLKNSKRKKRMQSGRKSRTKMKMRMTRMKMRMKKSSTSSMRKTTIGMMTMTMRKKRTTRKTGTDWTLSDR
jgi:hypothetical protein